MSRDKIFVLVVLIFVAICSVFIISYCEYKDGLFKQCITDGNKEYVCYSMLYGGRR